MTETRQAPDSPSGNVGSQKEESMLLQKQMLAGYFDEVAQAPQSGRKVVYTFVPGNLTELIRVFDLIPIYPEINALQNGMRKLSDGYIAEAERYGFASVCVHPTNVRLAAECLKGQSALVCSVVGFPHGANVRQIKAMEARRAIRDGAREVHQ